MNESKNELINEETQEDVVQFTNTNDKSEKISQDLYTLKNSFVNLKETDKKIDLLENIKSILPKNNKPKFLVEEAEAHINPNALPYIVLTENGFSKPVGTFDSVTRIANLTADIIDAYLLILISDVILDGSNHLISNKTGNQNALEIGYALKSVTIKNLTINTFGVAISISDNSSDITIQSTKIDTSLIGIIANKSRNLTIENNEISNALAGIVLLDKCSYTTISKNTLLNNNTGILINLRNSFNLISDNNIILTKSFPNEYGIALGNYNSYNTIEKNTIILSNRNFKLSQASVVFTSNAILISDIANTMNLIKENLFEFNNNNFTFNVNTIDYKIVQVKVFENNSELRFNNNKFVLTNNVFNIFAKKSIEVRQANLFFIQNTENEISDNTFINKNNSVNYINNDEVTIKSYFINLRFDDANNSVLACKNEFFNLSNSINPSHEEIKNYDIIFTNISVNTSNQVIDIEDNILEIKNDTNYTFETGVYVYQRNFGVGITRNTFKNIILNPITITENNYGNFITYNILENVDVAGIIVDTNNGLNVIQKNCFEKVNFFGIVLIDNNDSNLITENSIVNAAIGILFLLSSNEYNTISKNELCNNKTNIFIPQNSFNYLFENIDTCLKK